MAADTDLDPDAELAITRATAVLVVPGAQPWIVLRVGPDLLGVPLSLRPHVSSRDCSRPKRTTPSAGARAGPRARRGRSAARECALLPPLPRQLAGIKKRRARPFSYAALGHHQKARARFSTLSEFTQKERPARLFNALANSRTRIAPTITEVHFGYRCTR